MATLFVVLGMALACAAAAAGAGPDLMNVEITQMSQYAPFALVGAVVGGAIGYIMRQLPQVFFKNKK